MSKAEKQLTNTNRALEALSDLAPDADPSVLIATADELSKLSAAISTLKELGLVREVIGAVLLSNGGRLILRQSNEIEGE